MRIEENFPLEQLFPLATAESKSKHNYRPIYTPHKWWARRLESIFRTIGLSAFAQANDPADIRKRCGSIVIRVACTFSTLPEDPVMARKIKPPRVQRITESCYFLPFAPSVTLCHLCFSETLFRKYQKVFGVLVTATRDTKDPKILSKGWCMW